MTSNGYTPRQSRIPARRIAGDHQRRIGFLQDRSRKAGICTKTLSTWNVASTRLVILMQPTARDKGMEILVDYDLFLPTQFTGDRGRIRQVTDQPHGQRGEVHRNPGMSSIRVVGMPPWDEETARLHIIIEDTGIGIPEDKVGHIFGEFNQVDDEQNRKFDGTGLGLAISQKLIKLMDGDIWVDSVAGRGIKFGFLPLAAGGRGRRCRRRPDARGAETRPRGGRSYRKPTGNCGTPAWCSGYRSIVSCGSGADALAKLDQGIDLVLTTHTMPVMDGMELAEAIREAGHMVPIVLLSCNTGTAEAGPCSTTSARIAAKTRCPARPVHCPEIDRSQTGGGRNNGTPAALSRAGQTGRADARVAGNARARRRRQ